MAAKEIELALIKHHLQDAPVKGLPVDIALSEDTRVWTLVIYNRDFEPLAVDDKIRLIVFLHQLTKQLYSEYEISAQVVRELQ